MHARRPLIGATQLGRFPRVLDSGSTGCEGRRHRALDSGGTYGRYPKQSNSADALIARPLACRQRRGQPGRMRCRDGAAREARSLRSCPAIAACRLHAPPELRVHLPPLRGSSRGATPRLRARDGRAGRAPGAAPRTGTARGRPVNAAHGCWAVFPREAAGADAAAQPRPGRSRAGPGTTSRASPAIPDTTGAFLMAEHCVAIGLTLVPYSHVNARPDKGGSAGPRAGQYARAIGLVDSSSPADASCPVPFPADVIAA